MSETTPTMELHQERSKPEAKPARAAAVPADPAATTAPEIVTTIALKPGVKITIEYPA